MRAGRARTRPDQFDQSTPALVRELSDMRSSATAQHVSGERARVLPVFEQHLAVHDHELVAVGVDHVALAVGREVAGAAGLVGGEPLGIGSGAGLAWLVSGCPSGRLGPLGSLRLKRF